MREIILPFHLSPNIEKCSCFRTSHASQSCVSLSISDYFTSLCDFSMLQSLSPPCHLEVCTFLLNNRSTFLNLCSTLKLKTLTNLYLYTYIIESIIKVLIVIIRDTTPHHIHRHHVQQLEKQTSIARARTNATECKQ